MSIDRVVIVSTYPEHESKNIGDYLITACTEKLIRQCNPQVHIDVVWRAASWDEVKDVILASDHVFFACLAIRNRMETTVYPYIEKIIESGVPFSALASGTDLPVHSQKTVFNGFAQSTIKLLGEINEKAVCLTTRGVLSQQLCQFHGMDRAIFTGDIAFQDPALSDKVFSTGRPINRILVSDPHMAKYYLHSLYALLLGLKFQFPEAEIKIVLHSVNPVVEEFCKVVGMTPERIYENKSEGLAVYDEADLHVGYRVHAHVSALKRRVYSYLIEQDGRGCDYGLTIDRRISVPDYAQGRPQHIEGGISAAEQLLSIVSHDYRSGFRKFVGLEEQIETFNQLVRREVEKVFQIGTVT